MFDWFEPAPDVTCPACAGSIDEWQGKDGPCGLLVWRQGEMHPVDHRVDDEVRRSESELTRFVLPAVFGIYGHCGNGHAVDAACRAFDGVWIDTEPSVRDESPRRDRAQPDRMNR